MVDMRARKKPQTLEFTAKNKKIDATGFATARSA